MPIVEKNYTVLNPQVTVMIIRRGKAYLRTKSAGGRNPVLHCQMSMKWLPGILLQEKA